MLPLSAEEPVIRAVLDDDLIAAAAERELQCTARILFGLCKPRRNAEPDRQRNRGRRTRVDAVRLIQKREPLLLKLLHLLCFQHEDKASVVIPAIQRTNALT